VGRVVALNGENSDAGKVALSQLLSSGRNEKGL
jgi:hypothetical protein